MTIFDCALVKEAMKLTRWASFDVSMNCKMGLTSLYKPYALLLNQEARAVPDWTIFPFGYYVPCVKHIITLLFRLSLFTSFSMRNFTTHQ